MMSNVVNSTLVHNSNLPSNFFDELLGPRVLDEMMNNAYVYGREWLQNSLRSGLQSGNQMNATRVEKQVLEVWDRVYHQWLMRSINGSETHFRSFEAYDWDRLVSAFKSLDFALCFNLLKSNLDTIMSVGIKITEEFFTKSVPYRLISLRLISFGLNPLGLISQGLDLTVSLHHMNKKGQPR